MSLDGLDYGLSAGYEASRAPEAMETDMITIISRIIERAGGKTDQIRVEDLSGGHLAAFYGPHEFAHLSLGPRDIWIEFMMTPAMKQKYAVDERFAQVENKNQNGWHITLSRPEDLYKFEDVIREETI